MFIVFTAILCLFLQIAASQINVFNLIFAIILLFSKQVNIVIYKLFGLRHSLNELFYLPQNAKFNSCTFLFIIRSKILHDWFYNIFYHFLYVYVLFISTSHIIFSISSINVAAQFHGKSKLNSHFNFNCTLSNSFDFENISWAALIES